MEGSVITYSKYNIAIYEIKKEHKRLDLAVKKAVDDLSKIIQKIKGSRNDIYQEMKFMLQANKSIITSSSLIKDSKKRIETDLINAEYAITEELNKHSKIFKKIKDDYLKDRFDDVEMFVKGF